MTRDDKILEYDETFAVVAELTSEPPDQHNCNTTVTIEDDDCKLLIYVKKTLVHSLLQKYHILHVQNMHISNWWYDTMHAVWSLVNNEHYTMVKNVGKIVMSCFVMLW